MKNQLKPVRDRGSFRDSSGYVFFRGNEVLRTVNPIALNNFKFVLESGLINDLVKKDLIISSEIIEFPESEREFFLGARGEVPTFLLKHQKIPFISYPYEWTFNQLKDAAIAHLDLQLQCLKYGITLSDASSFNMQFIDGKFKHIDLLSLRPYLEGEPWSGYNQFCRMFLAPLLIEAWVGIPFQPLLRGCIDGLDLCDVDRIIPKLKAFTSLNALLHIKLQSHFISKANSSKKVSGSKSKITLPKHRYEALLIELRRWISGLKSGRRVPTYWDTYATLNTYSAEMRSIKKEFIAEWAKKIPGGVIWDIGGNTGDYSKSAVDSGISLAIIFDSDIDSLEKAYSQTRDGVRVFPLLMDIANPSPRQGWNQCERSGLNERSRPDGIIALAVIHHLAIGKNIPLEEIVNWFVDSAPYGIIEFVPKTDPMVVEMLHDREDIFVNYDEDHFLSYLLAKADVIKEHRFSSNNRLLVSYSRKSI